jgi:hypothetical protein
MNVGNCRIDEGRHLGAGGKIIAPQRIEQLGTLLERELDLSRRDDGGHLRVSRARAQHRRCDTFNLYAIAAQLSPDCSDLAIASVFAPGALLH